MPARSRPITSCGSRQPPTTEPSAEFVDLSGLGGAAVTLHSGTVDAVQTLPVGPGDTIGVVVEFTDPLRVTEARASFAGLYVIVGSFTADGALGTGQTATATSEGEIALTSPLGAMSMSEGAVIFQASGSDVDVAADDTIECAAFTLLVPSSFTQIGSGTQVTLTDDHTFYLHDVSWQYVENGNTTTTAPPIAFD